MRVLIYGDSQGEFMGANLAELFQAEGDQTTLIYRKGYTSEQLLEKAQQEINGADFDRVVILAGGNDAREGGDFGASVAGLIGMFPAGSVYWVGPAPQTAIGSMEYASQIWSSPVGAPNHFLGESWDTREAYNRQLANQVGAAGGTYLDLRDARLGGPVQKGTTQFPTLADGVHVTGQTAADAAAWIERKVRGSFNWWLALAAVGAAAIVWRNIK